MPDNYLTNYFLIAMPAMMDPFFHHAVIYVCEHNADGAMGIIINHPTDITLADVLEHMEIPLGDPRHTFSAPVLAGGPVRQERGFVIHRPAGEWQASLTLQEDIAVTTSRDILIALLHGSGPSDYLVALGYASWNAGMLEKEIANNDWLTLPVKPELLFKEPYADRWKTAGKLLGIDFDYQQNYLSDEAGHA
jgi:putative transcriptional regulator